MSSSLLFLRDFCGLVHHFGDWYSNAAPDSQIAEDPESVSTAQGTGNPPWLTPPNAADKFRVKRWFCLFRDPGVHGETGG